MLIMTASIGASCHIVQPSECQKYTPKRKTIPLTTITTPPEVHNSPLVPVVLRASASAMMYPFLASLSPAGELRLLYDNFPCQKRHRSLAFLVANTLSSTFDEPSNKGHPNHLGPPCLGSFSVCTCLPSRLWGWCLVLQEVLVSFRFCVFSPSSIASFDLDRSPLLPSLDMIGVVPHCYRHQNYCQKPTFHCSSWYSMTSAPRGPDLPHFPELVLWTWPQLAVLELARH